MSAAVVGQLVALRNQTGHIWSVELAGERARPPEATNRIDDPKGSAS
jgi:hypothetical protein